ncbi:MAG: O-antigen ligase family protein [Pseudomonadota bacterium]
MRKAAAMMMVKPLARRIVSMTLADIYLSATIFCMVTFTFLGGSSNAAYMLTYSLMLVSVVVLLGLVWGVRDTDFSQASVVVISLFLAVIATGLLQLVPLPQWLWVHLPGREAVMSSFELVRLEKGAMPLSLSPEQTLPGALRFFPALAVFILVTMTSWHRLNSMLPALVVGMGAISVVLGLLQLISGSQSSLYFYDVTNNQYPTGFFANVNHQASFLLMCLPFAGVVGGRIAQRTARGDIVTVPAILTGFALLLLVVGIALTGSGAGFMLLLPTAALTLIIFRTNARSSKARKRWRYLLLALIVGAGGVAVYLNGAPPPLVQWADEGGGAESNLARPAIFARTFDATIDHFPVGSGLGSFRDVYPAYEEAEEVTQTYINHVHNEYLEIALELGVIGILVIVAAILLYGLVTWRIWTRPPTSGDRLRRAGSVALGILLVHSIVDYPGRTMAIACLAAFCAAIMTRPDQKQRGRSPTSANQVSL